MLPAGSPQPNKSPRPIYKQAVRASLALLLEAHDCAKDSGRDFWQFAVELNALHAIGLTNSQLRWLLCQEYLHHAHETTRLHAKRRTFKAADNLQLHDNSCFILTTKGEEEARRLRNKRLHPRSEPSPPSPGRATILPFQETNPAMVVTAPRWDAVHQELSLGPHLIKKFKRSAPNQTAILAAFEAQGWPQRIANPLTNDFILDAVERLHDAIKRLNQNQVTPLIRFHGDGTGQGVTWELVEPSAPDVP